VPDRHGALEGPEAVVACRERAWLGAEEFPELRAGVARGSAFRHAGDCYGNSVNLASRTTGLASAGAVLATREVVDSASEAFDAVGSRLVAVS
jgi:class 3 adenylate cyclase